MYHMHTMRGPGWRALTDFQDDHVCCMHTKRGCMLQDRFDEMQVCTLARDTLTDRTISAVMLSSGARTSSIASPEFVTSTCLASVTNSLSAPGARSMCSVKVAPRPGTRSVCKYRSPNGPKLLLTSSSRSRRQEDARCKCCIALPRVQGHALCGGVAVKRVPQVVLGEIATNHKERPDILHLKSHCGSLILITLSY